jgi:uridine kinase
MLERQQEVGFDVAMARSAQRDGTAPDPQSPANRRYVVGQQLYLRTCEPRRYASIVLNNEALDSPFIVAR